MDQSRRSRSATWVILFILVVCPLVGGVLAISSGRWSTFVIALVLAPILALLYWVIDRFDP